MTPTPSGMTQRAAVVATQASLNAQPARAFSPSRKIGSLSEFVERVSAAAQPTNSKSEKANMQVQMEAVNHDMELHNVTKHFYIG